MSILRRCPEKRWDYVGIDIGFSGAIAGIQLPQDVSIVPMPVIAARRGKRLRRQYVAWDIRRLLAEYCDRTTLVVIEQPPIPRVLVRSGKTVSQTCVAQLHHGFGLLCGICIGLELRHVVVSPRTWQAEMFVGVLSGDPKAASVLVAKRLFPGVSLRRTDRCRKDDHNFADALLLAEYGRRKG